MIFLTNLFRNTLIGITSYGLGCANDIPGVFARITEVKNWILTNVPDAQESDCKNIWKYCKAQRKHPFLTLSRD